MIELSVTLPMFRAEHIAWLALESLCRQEDVGFEWELVVAEEQGDETFGRAAFHEYHDRLKNVGCTNQVYAPLLKWIPLAQKMVVLTVMCSHDSRIWVDHAADTYMPPRWLRSAYSAFVGETEWFGMDRTIYYDIGTEKTVLHVSKKNDGAGNARSLPMAYCLSRTNTRRHGIDTWLWESYRAIARREFGHALRVAKDDGDNWKRGFNTQGLNSISLGRAKRFTDMKRGFGPCPVDLTRTVPGDIIERLRECKKYLDGHKWGLPVRELREDI